LYYFAISQGAVLRIPAGNVDDLAAAIKRLIGDKGLRERMGEINHKKAQRYSWDESFKKIENFIIK
jgi:glycosyltransferase involved in cell wall biosynthesis